MSENTLSQADSDLLGAHLSLSPLHGKRIVITRAAHQADEFAALLTERGAIPLPYPCIAIVPPPNTSLLDGALKAASHGDYDWLFITSANTVYVLEGRLRALNISPSELRQLSIAVVGPSTAEALQSHLGLSAQIIPDEFRAAALAAIIEPADDEDDAPRVLLPTSELASPELALELVERGADVTVVTAYCTVIGSGGVNLPRLLASHDVNAITFTSASTVHNFMARLDAEGSNRAHLRGVTIACIGPSTARAAREHGLPVDVLPSAYTLPNLIRSLETYYDQSSN